MKHTIRRLLGVLTTVLWAIPCAQGQQIPPVREGDPMVRTTLENNRLTMVDVENDFSIILPGGLTFSSFAPGITGDVRLQQQPDGFDLVYTFTNTGAQPARLGRLNIGKFNLGQQIQYRDFRHTGEPLRADYTNFSFQSYSYPTQIYSPVWTAYNDQYTVSVSLQYPILDYRHDARLMVGTTPADAPASHGPRGWYLEYRFANLGGETPQGTLRWPGELPAGETRTYVVSVRVTRNHAEWIRTLVPYRDYYRSMYGSVRYQRDPRPIRPLLVATSHLISQNNPYGFDNYRNRRPDLYGWRPWADFIKEGAGRWSRVMLWSPSGLYNENRNMNFPFEFTTRWLHEERMANVFDEDVGLASVSRSGISLGLWWGRALQVSRGWNSGQWESFDPDNPAHVRACFDEMDLAVRAGATEIGLDTFNPGVTPIWKLVPWLERLQEAYPTVKFCIEPVTNDIMHRLAPTYVLGWTVGEVNTPEDINDLNNPHYLADLLLPGHESWGAFSYHRHRPRNFPVTPEIVQADMERIAAYGYVPVIYESPIDPTNVRAAESWLDTLPADVLRSSGWNSRNMNPRAVQRDDGRWVIVSDSGGAPSRATRVNGRVAGSVPLARPAPAAADDAPADGTGGVPVVQDDATDEVAAPTPIERAKRRFNIDLRIQREDGGESSYNQGATPELEAADLPGYRGSAAKGAKGKGKGGVNSAWLEILADKGLVNRADINRAVKGLPGKATSVKVVPSTPRK